MVEFPTLVGEIAKRGIKRKTIAESIGICDKSLKNKLSGKSPFTWPEVQMIRNQFFPGMTTDDLFQSDKNKRE